MEERFQHSIRLLLAFLVLCSTQSFSINTHYCGNIMVDKAIMKPAKKCAMHRDNHQANHEQGNADEDCCEDDSELFQGQDQLQLQSVDVEFPHPIFVEAFVYTFIGNVALQSLQSPVFFEYPPPLFQRNFQILYQVYLI